MTWKDGGGFVLEEKMGALAGVAQWVECWPVNQRKDGEDFRVWMRSEVVRMQTERKSWCGLYGFPSIHPSTHPSIHVSIHPVMEDL